ncbi:MAG: NACHT domain-containing protein [Chloroflexota bacterium]|nr:NACHT domain-containing protein [Chloroflexota bacterium]
MMIKNLEQWRAQIAADYDHLEQQVAGLSLPDEYQHLLALVLLPVIPTTAKEAQAFARLLDKTGLCAPLSAYWKHISKQLPFSVPPLKKLVADVVTKLPADERAAFDMLIDATGVQTQRKRRAGNSSLTLKMETLRANGSVVIAGHTANLITSDNQANEALLRYLAGLRATWNTLDLSTIVSDPARHVHMRLYQLYTPLDVWKATLTADRLHQLRRRDDEQDLTANRLSIIDALGNERYLIITGGPGTGKSTLSGFLTICLAYACDPQAEARDGVKGLDRLGVNWKYGALLPIYVNLRSFSSDHVNFPKTARAETADSLLAHLRDRLPDFQPYVERYLDDRDTTIGGAMLILDGLDEIYDEQARRKARNIIEDFAARYPRCCIVVTCRTAAYRPRTPWRLSDRFEVVELAPYTWGQIKQYIKNWYALAAVNRPTSFGNRDSAMTNATKYAANLIQTLQDNRGLWSLARQPLLLTLIALIHEENRRLPQNRGELYEKTVDLLHKWNPPNEDDPLAPKLATLNRQRVRQALQLTAFNLQRDKTGYEQDASIKRAALLDQLLAEQTNVGGLGATIEDVLEYLATRNGILVPDHTDSYRFLHLSIQEYLAACALIEQYNEVVMPRQPKPEMKAWSFPDNMCALLNDDPFRWREVALFCGAILGSDHGQDRLWAFVETLVPQALDALEEGDVYRIYIAGEVWAGNLMKTRLPSHRMIRQQLMLALKAVKTDERLDAPEHTQIAALFRQLSEPDAPLVP